MKKKNKPLNYDPNILSEQVLNNINKTKQNIAIIVEKISGYSSTSKKKK